MRAFLLVAALGACFALAGGVPAPALVAGGETVLFARSCEACDPEAYCEFTHPSAPADHVACVTIPTFRSLFRRYYSAWTAQTLGVGQRCTGAGKGIYLGDGVPEADVPNFANQCRNLCDDVTGSAPGLVAKVRRMGRSCRRRAAYGRADGLYHNDRPPCAAIARQRRRARSSRCRSSACHMSQPGAPELRAWPMRIAP
ncbi:hypothetical protein DFJ74DRAFT_517073 [Hyaloraphidium curvatum]|nr:hypothetical protein DFJ74DRAFT_517073 [Hyaloraphidium curvatum]